MLVLDQNDVDLTRVLLIKVDRLLHMPVSCFGLSDVINSPKAVASSTAKVRSWSDVKKIIDRIRRHGCGHSEFGDMNMLLERNKLWLHEVENYLKQSIARCLGCRSASLPQPSSKVSLSTLNRLFN